MTRWSKRLNLTSNVPHSFLSFIFLFTFSFVCLGKLFLLLSVEEWVLQSSAYAAGLCRASSVETSNTADRRGVVT